MVTRLIFSTLINFPGDIYILDEVLVVSDQSFKKKINKFNEKKLSLDPRLYLFLMKKR